MGYELDSSLLVEWVDFGDDSAHACLALYLKNSAPTVNLAGYIFLGGNFLIERNLRSLLLHCFIIINIKSYNLTLFNTIQRKFDNGCHYRTTDCKELDGSGTYILLWICCRD